MKSIFTLAFVTVSLWLSAQTGTLTGTMIDGEFNDVLPFASAVVQGTTTGVSSDFDGKYILELAPGTYTMEYSFVGYQTVVISDVVIVADKETVVDVTLQGAGLETVVITTTVKKNTETAVLQAQKQSAAVMDGLSSQSIKSTGASNVAAAVKAIPGVSITGGKYVYVRGLGDRYTKTILNGVDVPGLDPDRNALQLDIFPAGLLENLQVMKSATASQPADFTGGVVNIITRDLPSREEYSVGMSVGLNPEQHMTSDYLDYENSGTDFLGFDDGQRDRPIDREQNVPSPNQNPFISEALTQRLSRNLAAQRQAAQPNFGFSFTGGNSYKLENDKRLGVLASINYKNDTDYYDDFVTGQVYRKNEDVSVNELRTDRLQQGELGANNVLLTAMAGVSLKSDQSKYRFNALHVQNGERTASILRRENLIDVINVINADVLTYTQRSVTNLFLGGEHRNEEGDWKVDWRVSPSLAIVRDKDLRSTPFQVLENGTEVITPSESGNPLRIWRDLEEYSLPGKVDFTRKHTLFGSEAKFDFGAAYTYKNREFKSKQYAIAFAGGFQTDVFNGNPDEVLNPAFILDPDTGVGTFVREDSSLSDNFDSKASIAAVYAQDEFNLSARFKAVVGLRFEKYDLSYTGQRQDGLEFDNEKFLDKADFFPSANLIYDLDEEGDMKVRVGYSRTTARPSFKEASIAEIFDPVSQQFFIGNRDIQPTYIQNLDTRFELYGEGSEYFAVSAFYKSFKDPIELSFIREARNQFTPLNLGDAKVFGAEIEIRRNLDFLGMPAFSLNANASFIESRQRFSEDEEEARTDNLRDGESLDDNRQLQGQAPYLANIGLTYNNEDAGFLANLSYNSQGRTLEIVGNADVPDVYTLPFHSMNFNLSKVFGDEGEYTVGFKATNLLNDDIESVYESFGTSDQLYSRRSPNQEFSLSLGYKF